MVQGRQRSAKNAWAPSSAVQQACREVPARRQLRSGLRLPGRRSDGCPRAGRPRRRHRSQGIRVRIAAADPASPSHTPTCGGRSLDRWRCRRTAPPARRSRQPRASEAQRSAAERGADGVTEQRVQTRRGEYTGDPASLSLSLFRVAGRCSLRGDDGWLYLIYQRWIELTCFSNKHTHTLRHTHTHTHTQSYATHQKGVWSL